MTVEPDGLDPRAVVIGALATTAWYAVPDIVRPRWGRALAKTAVLGGGLALSLAATRDGRAARAAVDELRDRTAAAAEGAPSDPGETSTEGTADNSVDSVAMPASGASGRTGGAVVAAGLLLVGGVAVAGEIGIHRLAEGLGRRGWPAPHTTVGLVLGAAAAGLAAIDPTVSAERSRSAAE